MEQSRPGFCKTHPDAIIPTKGTPESAGYDLYALEDRTIEWGAGSVLVPTGVAIQLPEGTYGSIRARSGLAYKNHIAVNAGVIDADYYPRSIGVILYCTKKDSVYHIKAGDRCAQLLIEKICTFDAVELPNPNIQSTHVIQSSHAGFGSTGV